MWSTGEGNGKPLQYSCLENPMNSMKRQNDRIPKEELPRSLGAQYATGLVWEVGVHRSGRDACGARYAGDSCRNKAVLSDEVNASVHQGCVAGGSMLFGSLGAAICHVRPFSQVPRVDRPWWCGVVSPVAALTLQLVILPFGNN